MKTVVGIGRSRALEILNQVWRACNHRIGVCSSCNYALDFTADDYRIAQPVDGKRSERDLLHDLRLAKSIHKTVNNADVCL